MKTRTRTSSIIQRRQSIKSNISEISDKDTDLNEFIKKKSSLFIFKVLKQEIGWFDLDENNFGALITRLSSNTSALKGLSRQTLGAILNAMGALIFAFAVSFSPLMIFTEIMRGKQNAKKFGTKGSASSNSEEGGKVCS